MKLERYTHKVIHENGMELVQIKNQGSIKLHNEAVKRIGAGKFFSTSNYKKIMNGGLKGLSSNSAYYLSLADFEKFNSYDELQRFAWITDRLPTAEDADVNGNVAHHFMHEDNGISYAGWDSWALESGLPWQTTKACARFTDENPAPSPFDQEVNDQLMSSAPEMLGALKFIAEEYEDRRYQFGGDYLWKKHETDPLPKAKKAIAKAEGKEIS